MKKISLLLNASYDPFEIISFEKAMCLVFSEKADIVFENDEKKIRTVSKEFKFPEVIRLKKLVRFNKRYIAPTKRNVMNRDDWKCSYCGSTKNLTIDHIIPKVLNGTNDYYNLTTCCDSCNRKKGDKPLEQFLKETGYHFKRKTNIPTYLKEFRDICERNSIDSWKPFLFF